MTLQNWQILTDVYAEGKEEILGNNTSKHVSELSLFHK